MILPARSPCMGRPPISVGSALTFAVMVVSLSAPEPTVAMQTASAGVVQGTVEIQRAPPRRRAQRYPGGRPQAARAVQELPAVVYLRGVPRPTLSLGAPDTISKHYRAFFPDLIKV